MKKRDSMEMHKAWAGKIEVISRVKIENKEDLALAYTPGVAEVCLAIQKNPELSYTLTRRGHMIAVISDGSAVLGLGNIGALAAMPVMEGKSMLFKQFADIDAFPLVLGSQDLETIIQTIVLLKDNFAGINLEDISAPRCFEIEERLADLCDIPIFHDDQHGTAIVVLAGMMNALKVTHKDKNLKIVINGIGAAGTAIAKLLYEAGFRNITVCDRKGVVTKENALNGYQVRLIEMLNQASSGALEDALNHADAFIGVSAPDLLSEASIHKMNPDPILFALANPKPEIDPVIAKKAGAAVIATGRSDLPNQVNNVLVFPGIFKGLLSSGQRKITTEMKIEVAKALSALVDDHLSYDNILPDPFDKRVVEAISNSIISMK
jgi:malate dehydrogenase (oxaloacetate-decarboxylating)